MAQEIHQKNVDELRAAIREKLGRLEYLEIEQWFELVKKPDVSEITVVEIVKKIRSLVMYSDMSIGAHRLYRCRPLNKGKNPPSLLSGLLAPPISLTKQGRCNLAGNPVLYVSDRPSILVQECHIVENQHFVVLQFDHLSGMEQDTRCTLLGIELTILLENHPKLEDAEKFKVDFFGQHYEKARYIERKLHKFFVRDDDSFGSTYLLTSHLCSYTFSKLPDLEAILYPSIATDGSGHNYAFKLGTINRTYEPVRAGLCVLHKDGSVEQLDGATVHKDGRLEWGKDESIESPVPVGVRQIDPNDPDRYIAPWGGKN